VVLDASGATDQTIALSVALSDLVLILLCLDDPDYTSFLHAIGKQLAALPATEDSHIPLFRFDHWQLLDLSISLRQRHASRFLRLRIR
jgi:hypothetical protein